MYIESRPFKFSTKVWWVSTPSKTVTTHTRHLLYKRINEKDAFKILQDKYFFLIIRQNYWFFNRKCVKISSLISFIYVQRVHENGQLSILRSTPCESSPNNNSCLFSFYPVIVSSFDFLCFLKENTLPVHLNNTFPDIEHIFVFLSYLSSSLS